MTYTIYRVIGGKKGLKLSMVFKNKNKQFQGKIFIYKNFKTVLCPRETVMLIQNFDRPTLCTGTKQTETIPY